jgi:LCP family protein required for cell wall assembly
LKFKNASSAEKLLFSFLITFGIVIAVMAVAGGVYAAIGALSRPPVIRTHVESEENDSERAESLIDADTPPATSDTGERKPLFYTFLFFAIDSGNNADVIIVGAFDTQNNQAYAINIPRDTRIDVPRDLRKPVASYAVGRAGGRGHVGGVAQMLSDMQNLFGFRPDYYVSVNEQAFIRIVDSVGGVTVNVPFNMRYDDPIQNLHINISAGTQTLNGRNALHFARYRRGNSGYRTITDYERIENQQQVIRALFDQLMTPSTITRIPELAGIYNEFVNTSLNLREQLWFANQLRGTEIHFYTLPTGGTSGAPGWYELPDRDAILELINSTVNPFTQDITAEMVSIIEE